MLQLVLANGIWEINPSSYQLEMGSIIFLAYHTARIWNEAECLDWTGLSYP